MKLQLLLFLFLTLSATPSIAEEVEWRYRVTGFFMPERAEAIRKSFKELHEDITVARLDFDTATVTLRFDPSIVVPRGGRNSATQFAVFNQMLRGQTKGVIALLPRSEVPQEQLREVAIPIAGLDCIGCSYAAYETVRRVDGVDYAIASFRDGRVVVRYDSKKTSDQELVAALQKRQISLNYRITDPHLIPAGEMKIVRFSSEEPGSQGFARNAIDGDPQTKWESHWHRGQVAEPPHELVIDLGRSRKISGFRYLARQLGSVGAFAKTEFFVSDHAEDFGARPAAKATFVDVKVAQSANCPKPVTGRYVLVRMLSEINGKPNGTAAEIGVVAP